MDERDGGARLTVTYRVSEDSFTGHVRAPREAPRPFTGWLGLLSALEAAVRHESEGALRDP